MLVSRSKKYITLIIIAIIVFTFVGIYIYYSYNSMKDTTVPLYLWVNKKESTDNGSIEIHITLGTTKWKFHMDGCIDVLRIPENINPSEVVNNQSLFDIIDSDIDNYWRGWVPFNITNSKKDFTFYWNETVANHPPPYSKTFYKAFGGYYIIDIVSYYEIYPDSVGEPMVILTNNSIFHIDGVYCNIHNDSLSIDYMGKNKPHFTGKIVINENYTYTSFEYTGEKVEISLAKAPEGVITLETSIGTYAVGYYEKHNKS